MDDFNLEYAGSAQGHVAVRMRCPACRHIGTFEPTGASDLRRSDGVRFGIRRCPNPTCYAGVFVLVNDEGGVLRSFPPEVIDFDATNLPDPVLSALTEAIQCHAASAYRAAALMVRRTLEDVCADREAEGDNLKQRLAALRAKVAVPQELLDGLDDLRLLGNDAAHVELKDFDEIGQEEAELAIDITKELLKGVYQHASLVARLAARKRT